ncbi:hypothetical protein PsYK624_160130 [Phanerochaete sordida]|uniref:DUF6533 domain-containing protein n=1 Tax=Phanerochaete sordida TaxID=48140 RepID=A0A9P3GQP0_9APHY|nr:hypothetical protein PsYK624_160130 [Phanerochaete sordida]
MSNPAAYPGVSISYVNALAIGKRSRGAAIGLLFYDHLISLDREIPLVWKADKRRSAFWLYIFNRFFAFVYYVWDCIPLNPSGTTTSKLCDIPDVRWRGDNSGNSGSPKQQSSSSCEYMRCTTRVERF